MNPEESYKTINKHAWNLKTDVHVASEFYDNQSFLNGKSTLKEIELDLLGDLSGKSVLHLQCHFGQDSISMARMGAEVVGVDLADKAIKVAQEMAEKTNTNASFICCDLYDLPQHLDRQFDVVFTSYGTIGWLPNLDLWAKLISKFLKPSGKFVFVEFHPFIWMYDDHFQKVEFSYFKSDAIIENISSTYADKETKLEHQTISWNHGLAEVMMSLINNGLEISNVKEYDYSPYDCFDHVREVEAGKFILDPFGRKVPLVYSIVASPTS